MNPGIIILLGAVAAKHVLGFSEGIMKLRGRWLEYRVGDVMIPVMATLHPAYLLRQPAHKKLAWRDLQAVEKKILALGLLEKTATVR
jgi:DNA polymerase